MNCDNVQDAVESIRSFFKEESEGRCFLVNTENYDVCHQIFLKIRDDRSIRVVRQSTCCHPNGAPDVYKLISTVKEHEKSIAVGLSQALAFAGTEALSRQLGELLDRTDFSNKTLILVEHCRTILKDFVDKDVRRERRVLFVESDVPSPLPAIQLANNADFCNDLACKNFPELFRRLEDLTCAKRVKSSPITVLSSVGLQTFDKSLYRVVKNANAYETLCQKYEELASVTKEEYGTEEQWSYLLKESKKYPNFALIVEALFTSTQNLSLRLEEVKESRDPKLYWLLWLALKVYGDDQNLYLKRVLKNSNKFEEFEERLFLEMTTVEVEDSEFSKLFKSRKKLIKQALSFNEDLARKYCDVLGARQRNKIFYLTDLSDREKHDFLLCLNEYSYSDKELTPALKNMSENLSFYMKEFVFDVTNTAAALQDDAEASTFRKNLTTYFNDYKSQKLRNKIVPKFLELVEKHATSRPYNKLTPRSKIANKTPKDAVQVYFFDALGVEYLAFILEKSKKYQLCCEIAIARCELPSLTSFNKDFNKYFPEESIKKVSKLDEIKHDSLKYDYTKCVLPIHIFEELKIIDDFLRTVKTNLALNPTEKVVVFSDHGASRLAVINEQEAPLELEKKGVHSGRCCPSATDPKLPFAAYETKYSCLANYQRFKGGRKADVEVHGGATLEETLVPVLTFSLRPANLETSFIESKIYLQPGVTPELTLYASQPLENPKLLIKGEIYEGVRSDQKNCYRFQLANLKRKGSYEATIFEGNANLGKSLPFELTKKTSEKDLF